MSDNTPDLPTAPAIDEPGQPPYVDIVTDLANVLTLVDRIFVGPIDVRCEIKRVLGRYADENRKNMIIAPAPTVLEDLPSEPHGVYRKEICYDRETRDYAMYLDGELVGFQRNYREAEITLDQLVFELMTGMYFREAA